MRPHHDRSCLSVNRFGKFQKGAICLQNAALERVEPYLSSLLPGIPAKVDSRKVERLVRNTGVNVHATVALECRSGGGEELLPDGLRSGPRGGIPNGRLVVGRHHLGDLGADLAPDEQEPIVRGRVLNSHPPSGTTSRRMLTSSFTPEPPSLTRKGGPNESGKGTPLTP